MRQGGTNRLPVAVQYRVDSTAGKPDALQASIDVSGTATINRPRRRRNI